MMGKLKASGLALLAVVALAGVTAQATRAATFQAESYPAAISGQQEAKHLFETVANTLSCKKYEFAGELSSSSNELALTGSPQECSTAGVVVMTVNMNGCTFNFNVGAKIGEGKYEGAGHIACPAGKEIVWSATNGCTAKIPPQTLTATITLENKATGPKKSILLSTEATGISYTIESGFFCLGSPKSGPYTNGKYTGSTKLTAANGEAKAIDLTVE